MNQQTQLHKNFDKKDFNPGASALKITCWYLTSMLFFRSGLMPISSVLVFLLRLFGAKIGKDVRIKPYIYVHYPWKLSVGDYSWLAECRIENLDQVNIGNNVCVSQQAMLLTGNHDYKKTGFDLITKPITLEDGVWIGAKAIVCPGIKAHSHAVLTVGSIATKDLAAYSIYQGNPAVKVKDRTIS
ncbi:WcaF family extracellular polysaccharide biosynthesis acetyltransferase [Pedobacter sp. KR3-3]|uniref:WcaF family extracellular polysaccharide biosynthesis acetyltransferase n=1 Tax=Pedobacter albus TaxID=3113905 RepID=A0ABU7I7F2_9SPHI|nr:WcaF family extracellular polysaccharide biosynthesis acetyltransferase [Pedobacter sp. KR3-3]MEE1945159.1 WcaF family extracellular polysaccharide biosynthesis acetyltransferase [Pedobacter sp. KR3-3]